MDDEGVEDLSKFSNLEEKKHDCVAAKHFRNKMTKKEKKLQWFTENTSKIPLLYSTQYPLIDESRFRAHLNQQYNSELKCGAVIFIKEGILYILANLFMFYQLSLGEKLLVFDIIPYILKFSRL